jgi:hypothetical protein
MPWRGPSEPGEYPTLGYEVGEWIEENCVVPDGYLQGQPYKLTDEMWRYLLKRYRVYPYAAPWPAPDALMFYGSQLRRSQKWGKDPLGAAMILANALGPTRFDGWDAAGEPVGAPYPTPLIVCLGTSEDARFDHREPPVHAAGRLPQGVRRGEAERGRHGRHVGRADERLGSHRGLRSSGDRRR